MEANEEISEAEKKNIHVSIENCRILIVTKYAIEEYYNPFSTIYNFKECNNNYNN